MKRNIVLTIFFLAALLLSLAGAGAVEDGRACSLRSVAGEWGYTFTGTLNYPTPTGPTLFAGVGKYIFDAEGNVSSTQTSSLGGTVVENTITGTITVNSDCTGTITVSVYDQSGTTLLRKAVWAVLFDDNVREFRAIMKSLEAEPGDTSVPPIVTEEGKRLFPHRGGEH